jgi:molybdate transport system regulatory protein
MKLKSKQWIVDDHGRIIIGEGRKEILENIERTGSINQTAKIMKMSYKGVWSKIKASETYMNAKIVETDRKKGAWLTDEGRELLRKYTRLKATCEQTNHEIFDRIFGCEEPDKEGESA